MQNRIILSLLLMLVVSAGLDAQQPLQLSLKDAVDAALEPAEIHGFNLAREAVRQAEARAAQARAELLPDVSASIGQQSRMRSLAELGLRSDILSNGTALPSVVGPFNTFDARGTLSPKIFDFSAVRRYQAARTETQALNHSATSFERLPSVVAFRITVPWV